MSTKRRAAAVAAVFLASQVLAILMHGLILAADYAPFYGRLLRPMNQNAGWPIFLLPLAHLVMSIGFVAIFSRWLKPGPTIPQGMKFGALAWLLGPAPMYLLWFAEQPWPSSLLVKQLPLELVAFIILGLVTGLIAAGGRKALALGMTVRGR